MRIVRRISPLLTIVCYVISSGYAQTNDCGLEKFRCHNGECIAGELLCDGKANCRDSSDETQAECTKPEILCPAYAFRCKYGACINGDALCNGIQDCVDNSDETQPQCRRTSESNNQTVRPTYCRGNQFTCDNGQCINNIDVCDGNKDCTDGSDEVSARCGSLTCPPTVFRCAYGACIDGDLRCNGIINCADGSDEDPKLCGGDGWPSQQPSSSRPPYVPPTAITRPTQSSTEQTSGTFVPPYGRRTCKAPPQPQNGHWKLHRSQCSNTQQDCDILEGVELGLGSYIIYSCNLGHKIEGSPHVSCTIEGWLNIPVCTEIRCESLTSASIYTECTLDDDWVSCDSSVKPRTRAKLSCRDSYQRETNRPSPQSENVKCNANGEWEPEPIRCVPVCGLPPSINSTALVVGGYQPNVTEFPWHASLYFDDGRSKKYFCGASIIQENLLITAAHCVYNEDNGEVTNPNKIYVSTGNLFRDYDSSFHISKFVKKNKVKHIYMICNYLGYSGNYVRDIAVLELVESFVFTATLVPICLDLLSDRSVLEPGAEGKVAGFGRTATGETSGILQALGVPYVPFSVCKSASQDANTQQYITPDKFCAGYTNGSSVCDGDSGGGLVFKSKGLWYIRGIVSVSLGTILQGETARCDNNLYALYTRISSHIDWIQNVIAKIKYNQAYTYCTTKT